MQAEFGIFEGTKRAMNGKKALVTGASEGIGREFARALSRQGYRITAVARNESRLQHLMEELGGEHRWLTADLADPQGVQKVLREIEGTHYDLLVNNAGMGLDGNFMEVPLEKLQVMTRLNCDSLVALTHAYLRAAKPGDALINVASMVAFLPLPESALYSATKAFVLALSETLWEEQKKRGVYVMGLCPGITTTEFHSRAGIAPETLPKPIIQRADQVVAEAMAALRRRRKPTVVTGWKNRFGAMLPRLLSRRALMAVLGMSR